MKPETFVLALLLCAAVSDAAVVVERPPGTKYPTLLSLDGGGLRQYMTNQVLKRLQWIIQLYFVLHPEYLPPGAGVFPRLDDIEVHLADFFDCIAGTSAGSWVGMYYASKGGNGAVADFLNKPQIQRLYGDIYPGSADGVDVFFEEFSDQIYPPDPALAEPTVTAEGVLIYPGVNCPRYPHDGLESALDTYFADTTLTDLKTSAIVNAYDLAHRFPVLFSVDRTGATPVSAATIVRSRSAPRPDLTRAEDIAMQQEFAEFLVPHEADLDIRFGQNFFVKDVVRASSAFPMIHGAKLVEATDGSAAYLGIDGAVTANDPVFHALNFMVSINTANVPQDIATLSIGTGVAVGEVHSYAKAGPVDWELSGALPSILAEAGTELTQSNMDTLLYQHLHIRPGQYLRINVFANEGTPEGDALTEVTNVAALGQLKNLGESAADEYDRALRNFVERYIFAVD